MRLILAAFAVALALPAFAGQDPEAARAGLKKIPGVGSIVAETFVPDGSAWRVKFADDAGVSLYVLPGPDSSWHAAILPARELSWKAGDLWDAADAFGDASVSPRAVVVSSAAAKLDPRKWPKALAAALKDFPPEVHAGVTGFMTVAPGKGGALARIQDAIGSKAERLLLSGRAGPQLLKNLLPKAGDPASPALALDVSFPACTPPAFQALPSDAPYRVAFPSTVISIATSTAGLVLSGRQKVELSLLDKSLLLDNEISISKSGDAWSLACKASIDAAQDPFGMARLGFVVKKFFLAGDLAGSSAPGRKLQGFGLGVGAVVAIEGAGEVEADLDAEIRDGKLAELSLGLRSTGPKGLAFSRLPGLKLLPGAREFVFHRLGIGIHATTRRVFLHGEIEWTRVKVRASAALVVGGDSDLALFFKAAGLRLSGLSPDFPKAVDALPLDNALFAISTSDLARIPAAQLPSPVRAMMAEVGASTEGRVSFGEGLTVLTAFTPGEEAAKLGLEPKPIVLAGRIGGLFGGEPGFELYADLGSFKLPDGLLPKSVKPKRISPKLFLAGRDLRKAPVLDLGVELDSTIVLGKDTLELGLRTYITMGASGAGVRVTGLVRGDWHDALGLKTVTLSDGVLGFGVSADGSASISVGGRLTVDKDSFDSRNTLGISPVGGFRYVGISFEADLLSPVIPLKFMDILVRSVADGPLAEALPAEDRKKLAALTKGPTLVETARKSVPIDLVEVEKARFYLATPGTPSDPDQPAIQGMGIAVEGRLKIERKRAGELVARVTEAEGMRLAGDVADLDLGPLLSLKGAKLDLDVPMPLQGIPSFLLKGKAKVLIAESSLDVQLGIKKLKFATRNDWGAFGHADFRAESLGESLLKPTDFVLELDASADLKNGIRKELGPAMTKLLESTGEAERKALEQSRADLAGLKKNLADVRAAAKANQQDAQAVIKAAERDVKKWEDRWDDVDDDIEDKKDDISDAEDDPAKWPKIPGYEIELAALYVKRAGIKASCKVAKAALKAAKEATGAIPVDAYPEVVAAQALVDAKEAEVKALEATQVANEAAAGIAKQIQSAAKSIPLAVESMSFKNGRMSRAIRGEPQRLEIKVRVEQPGKQPATASYVLSINLMNPTQLDLLPLAAAVRDAIAGMQKLEEADPRRAPRKTSKKKK